MSEEDSKTDAYAREAAFLGFPPVAVIDDVINCVEDYLCDGMDVLEKTLTKLEALKPQSSEVGKGVDGLLERASKSASKSLDKFELYTLQNIFRIPAGVTFTAEPNKKRTAYTAEEEAQILAKTVELRKKLKASKYLNRKMKQELSAVDSELAAFKALLEGENGSTVDGLLGHSQSEESVSAVKAVVQGSVALESQMIKLQALAGQSQGSQFPNSADPAVNFQRDQGTLPLSTDQLKGAASGF